MVVEDVVFAAREIMAVVFVALPERLTDALRETVGAAVRAVVDEVIALRVGVVPVLDIVVVLLGVVDREGEDITFVVSVTERDVTFEVVRAETD